jgi:hypothetical protein
MSLVVAYVTAESVQHIAAAQIRSVDQWHHGFIHCEQIPDSQLWGWVS